MQNPFRNLIGIDKEKLIAESFHIAATTVVKVERTEEIIGTTVERAVQKEGIRIKTVGSLFHDRLLTAARAVPNMDKIPGIYRELAESILGRGRLKKAVEDCRWGAITIKDLQMVYLKRIKYARHTSDARERRREFYGRAVSVLNKIKRSLAVTYDAAPLRRLPDFQDLPTVIIAGLPNVGKSSLLKILTGADPEIAPYPFTTKGLMLGYAEFDYKKIQFIDTPGLLDRPLAKRTAIEKAGIAALRHLANIILYIFDPSETAGFTIEQQYSLYKELGKTFGKPMITVANKIDIPGGRALSDIKADVLPISCETKQGIEEMKSLLRAEIKKISSD